MVKSERVVWPRETQAAKASAPRTMACTRPEGAWMSSARLKFSFNVSRRVMPGVMSPLHVEPMKIPAAPRLNVVEAGWIMRAAD